MSKSLEYTLQYLFLGLLLLSGMSKGIEKAFIYQFVFGCLILFYILTTQSHWKFHKLWCKTAKLHSSLPPEKFQSVVPIGRRGKMGLYNIGNSCYLNSSLQCMSHIAPLTAHFLSLRYELELNPHNKDGTGGKLANEFCNLLKVLWFDQRQVMQTIVQ